MSKKPYDGEAVERQESVRQAFAALRDQVHWAPNTPAEEVAKFYITVARTVEGYIKTGEM